MNDETRATLLERLHDGADPLVWDEFFERYGRLIYAAARARACSEHTAEEIVQDVMLTLFQGRDVFRYDPARGRFRDWLCGVVRNKVYEFRRRPSERVRARGGDSDVGVLDVEAEDATPDEAWQAVFEASLLAVLLDVVRREVNPRTYQAFELLTLGEMSGSEVARITGLSRNAVYQARRKVFARLKELGATYRENGRLRDGVKQALELLPSPAAQRSLTTRIAKTMRSR
ncbi:MAG TPA: sigma-70 family RNA polymerase sigma factor [Thermoguttaceae bacterium]|nr:sigma-70 family RNA polymerase sigma factor [Thermoguttaceae bacterium]